MRSAPPRKNETESLDALRALEVLDSAPEAEFEALVKVATIVCGVPISLISLIDVDRQWFKANEGLSGVTETPRELAFCAHAVLGDDLFEVPDATQDDRFADNPLVAGQPDIRFYAGAPLILSDGVRVGTLCVIDRQPRTLNETQRNVLKELSVAAARALEGRLAMRKVREAARVLKTREQNLSLVVDHVPSMMAYWNADLRCRFANSAYEHWFGVEPKALVGTHIRNLLGPELFALNKPYLEAALRGEQQTFERVVPGPGGVNRHSLAIYIPDVVAGKVVGILVQVTDVTKVKETEAVLRVEMAERERVSELLRVNAASLQEAQRLGKIGSWEWQISPDVTTWSEELYRILGRDPGTPAPTYAEHSAMYVAQSWSRLQAAVERALQSGEPYALELEFIRKDGRPGWIDARGATVRNEAGTIVGLRGTVQDINEKKQLTLDLAHQHELLRVTLQSIGDAVITTDGAGQVTWLNPVAERMTGWLTAEAKGRPLAHVFHILNDETREVTESPVTRCLAQGRIVGLANHTVLISRNGSEFGIEDSAAPIRNDAGEVLGAVLVFHDVSEQRRMSGEMSYRATHDALTGLVNRAEFETRLERLLRKSHEEQSEHALLYLDLDQFKLVNDACGHAIGDQLLQQVSKLLAGTVRARDTLARLGGDEFGIILEACSADQAQRVAQKICDSMDDFRFIHDGRRFRIGASIGLVPVDRRWTTTAAIQQAADTSCYAAKEAGRNRVHAWFDTDAAMRARQGEMQWTSRIEHALDDDGFVLFAQRIQPLRGDSRGVHAEVLLRMKNDDGSLVPPGAFLPAAERFHLISRVDRWVLGQASSWMKNLASLDAIEMLSVNLSGQSVGDRSFHGWACDLLAQLGQSICGKLCLELTETAAVTNMADAAIFIDKVRAMGVKVALDDFGAGASSFGYLKNLAVDYLKIDGQFVRDVVSDPLDEAAVRCFTNVAKVLGVRTVAEFVDQEDVLERLREIGVDFAQGFLIHRPAPIDELLVTSCVPS
jgi:diguanylate cyclase (GGDEF)-like protein/PAS domain S-box-containing protein